MKSCHRPFRVIHRNCKIIIIVGIGFIADIALVVAGMMAISIYSNFMNQLYRLIDDEVSFARVGIGTVQEDAAS